MKFLNKNSSSFFSVCSVILFCIFGIWCMIGIMFVETNGEKPIYSKDFTALNKSVLEKDNLKAEIVVNALFGQLKKEIDTFPGYIVNDIGLLKFYDNKSNYQRGIIYAVRGGADVIKNDFARHGRHEEIYPSLVDATKSRLAFSEDKWILPSSESMYKKGIEDFEDWAKNVKLNKNKAVYNVRTDDLYNILMWMNKALEVPHGQLNTGVSSHFEADDIIYYTKGVAIVVRDMLITVSSLHPELSARGGDENIKEAIHRLDMIVDFNPIYIFAGGNDIGDGLTPNHPASLARHVDIVRSRIADALASLEK